MRCEPSPIIHFQKVWMYILYTYIQERTAKKSWKIIVRECKFTDKKKVDYKNLKMRYQTVNR